MPQANIYQSVLFAAQSTMETSLEPIPFGL